MGTDSVVYSDDAVEIFGELSDDESSFAFQVKTEGAEAYEKLIDYLTDQLREGIYPAYSLRFESVVQNELMGDANDMSRFWANCVQYPELHEKMRKYIEAANEVGDDETYYDDGNAEDDYRHLGSYAVTALILSDPSGEEFVGDGFGGMLGSFDLEYVTWPGEVMEAYLDQYGITENNIDAFARLVEDTNTLFLDGYFASHPGSKKELNDYMEQNGYDPEYLGYYEDEEE